MGSSGKNIDCGIRPGLNPRFENSDHNTNIIYSVIAMHQAVKKAFKCIVLLNPYNISV